MLACENKLPNTSYSTACADGAASAPTDKLSISAEQSANTDRTPRPDDHARTPTTTGIGDNETSFIVMTPSQQTRAPSARSTA